MSQSPRSELAGILFQEIEGYLPEIENGISVLQNSYTNHAALKEIHRLFHNIKGAASQVAFNDLSNSAAICEAVLTELMESSSTPAKSHLEFLDMVNGHIRDFCTLNDKTSQAEQSLLSTTLSFFKKLMAQAGNENSIILPEHIQELLRTDGYHAIVDTRFLIDTDPDLRILRIECLASLHSIVPMLQELTDCSKHIAIETLPTGILQPMMNVLSTLALCSRTAGLTSQEQLICSFLDILDTFRQNPDLADSTTPGLLKEFISYLDLIFALPPSEGESVIATVQNHLARIVNLFSDISSLPSPPSVETISSLTERNDFVKSDENDLENDLENDFLQNLCPMELDGDKTSELIDPDEIELFAIFQTECSEHLQAISTELGRLNINEDECTHATNELRGCLNRMRISVHTLKGAAAMTGFSHIAVSAFALEKFLNWMHDNSQDISGTDVAVIHRAVESLRTLSECISQSTINTAKNNTEKIEDYLFQRIQTTSGKLPEREESSYTEFESAQTADTDQFIEVDDYIDFSDIFPEDYLLNDCLASEFLEEIDNSDINPDLSTESLLPSGYADDQQQDLQDDESELLLIFQSECDEHLLGIHRELNLLAAEVRTECDLSPDLRESIARMRRGIHTLKGAAAMTGLDDLTTCAHAVEDLLDWLHDDASIILPGDVSLIAESIDTLELLSQSSEERQLQNDKPIAEQIREHLHQRLASSDADNETSAHSVSQHVFPKNLDSPHENDSVLPIDNNNVRVKLSELEELVNIEGELVVSRGSIEKLLDRFSQSLDEMDTIKDTLRRKSNELEVGFEAQSLYGFGSGSPLTTDSAASFGSPEMSEFDPIELDRYSQLNLIIRSLNEISIDVNAIHSQMTSLASGLQGQVAKQQLAMGMMQEKLLRIRMTPLSTVSRTLFRTVRKTAKRLGKNVQLKITGKDILMDRFIWSRTIDPLMHLLRNAIDHGIESAYARESANKPATAQITLDAAQRGRMVVLKISDDGQGIDTERLRNTLIAENIIPAGTPVSDQDLLPYLFRPSVSTRDDVSQTSGRGVGLDVVLRNIQELRGKVQIINSPGKGVTFEINIPITLSVNRAVIIEINSKLFAIPIQDITEVRKFRGAEILKGVSPQVLWNGKPIQLLALASFLNIPSGNVSGSSSDALTLVIDNGNKHVAMQIDRVDEQREVVIKDLGSHLRYVKGISGVTLTGEGAIIPILNLSELAADQMPAAILPTATQAAAETRRQEPLKVMVVDDSISVRYSITRLVQGRSWQAYQAVDGIDALEKLEELRPDVIILDIEMPRMNGYEFMSILRNSEDNSSIPVIMLTSRASDKHRNKAEKLGVNHYLTKPFQEDDFIQLLSTMETNR